jgi:hypothetical protein
LNYEDGLPQSAQRGNNFSVSSVAIHTCENQYVG